MNRRDLVYGLWIVWAGYWWISSLRVKAVRRKESVASRLGHLVPLWIAAVLLALPHLPGRILEGAWIPATAATYWLGLALTLAGIAFAVWARVVLAGNWSGTVTVKADHELVHSGPYARIRHPIYSGLLVALLGTSVCIAQWRALLAVAMILVALLRKLHLEERWLTETFGSRYTAYRDRTWALFPLLF